MADLVSSVPGIFDALLGLVQTAAAGATNPVPNAPDPKVYVYPCAIGDYVPGAYVTVEAITGPMGSGQGPQYHWETIGSFSQKEIFGIKGRVVVFSGDAPTNNPMIATQVLGWCFSLFQQCVMTPVMSNRNMPFLGTAGPSPYLMLPARMGYAGGPGVIGGAEAGWDGTYDWSFHFESVITPV